MAAPDARARPTELDPSELGTKDYWDRYYLADLSNLHSRPQDRHGEPEERDDVEGGSPSIDPSDLPSWFSDHAAPAKILRYLSSPSFPLAPAHWPLDPTVGGGQFPCILDLGSGNGSLLFLLRTEGAFRGNRMMGIDYSPAAVELAGRLGREIGDGCDEVEFRRCDVLRERWWEGDWWPRTAVSTPDAEDTGGWDIVLDKGTFDAVSLSADVADEATAAGPIDCPRGEGAEGRTRIHERYPAVVAAMLRPGGFFLITSCNWTEEELLAWFTPSGRGGSGARLDLHARIPYTKFRFGGHEGQGVVSLVFQRRAV